MIHQAVTGKWCGPSALTLLTGRSYASMVSYLAFLRDTPYSEVNGVWNEEVILALNNQGFSAVPVNLAARYCTTPTLLRYMRERPVLEKVEPTLIQVYKHVVVGHYDFLADNANPRPVHYEQFPKPRRLVENVFIIRRRIT